MNRKLPRKTAIDQDTTARLLKALYAAPHGVYAMSQDIPGLVETSTNLASVKMKPNNVIRIETSQRSSILSARDDMANTVRSAFQLAGANVTFGEGYPGWKPNPHSAILEVAAESYKRLFGVDAKKNKGDSCRTGMRSVPRQVSDARYDFFRPDLDRSSLS